VFRGRNGTRRPPPGPVLGSSGDADMAGYDNSLPDVPSMPAGVGAPMGSGTLPLGGAQSSPPNGSARGWWGWAKALLQSTALKSLQLPVPEQFLIPGGQEFFALEFANTSAAGVVEFPDLVVTLPKSQEGWISSVTFFMGGASGGQLSQTNYATFTLLVNGTPVPGWGAFSTFPRVAFSVQTSSDAQIRVPSGRTISGYANNTDGGTYVVGLGFSGWRWPLAAAQRWRSGQST
jgi:hypothetical protein